MRFLIAFLLAAVGSMAVSYPQTARDLPLNELLTPKDYRKYREKEKYKDRLNIYREAMSEYGSVLHDQVHRRQLDSVDSVLAKLKSLAAYAVKEPTHETASDKDLRSKEVKKLEIAIRKLVDNLNDLKLSVPLEYRDDFDSTMKALEDLRNQLLKQLFGLQS